MIEPRREQRLAHEALQRDVVAAQALVQHLDDRLAPEKRLLAPVHGTEPAFVDPLAKDELAKRPSTQVFEVIRHRRRTLSP